MRLRLRSLMLIVALLALGFASPDPVLALTLIFTCPIWFVVLAAKLRDRPPLAPAEPPH
jgi:hypothetical protein